VPRGYCERCGGVSLVERSCASVDEADRSGILDLDVWDRAGGRERSAELHQRSITTEHVNGLRMCAYAGRPFGEEEFLEKVEGRAGSAKMEAEWQGSRTKGRKWMGGCPRREILKWAGQAGPLSWLALSAGPLSWPSQLSQL
jgi:hypothetical protein